MSIFNDLFGSSVSQNFEEINERALHSKFPENFEYYLIALEVRDEEAVGADQQIIRNLIFPVNPERLMHQEKKIAKKTKTAKGIVINNLETFVPMPFNLSGTFGRKLRILYGSKISDTYTQNVFEDLKNIKTGYGTTKALQEIFELSKATNKNGNPYRVIFYNLAFSSVYIVELDEIRFSQSMDKNRLWYYDLQMTLVSPLEDADYSPTNLRIQKLMNSRSLSKVYNNLFSNVQSFTNSTILGKFKL